MARLDTLVQKVRSKNAGPFWLTVDIFCGTPQAFQTATTRLSTAAVARAFGTKIDQIKRFEIEDLCVLKFSLPRPYVQGSIHDPDMHGASWAALIAELDV